MGLGFFKRHSVVFLTVFCGLVIFVFSSPRVFAMFKSNAGVLGNSLSTRDVFDPTPTITPLPTISISPGACNTNINIAGNGLRPGGFGPEGAGSSNNAIVICSSSNSVNQSNNTNINTTINVSANTGENSSENNTGGPAIVQTGSSITTINLNEVGGLSSN